MAEDYYPGADGGGDEPMPEQKPQGDGKAESDKAEGESALLPKAMFGGKDPQAGEEYVFRVVRTYEDEVEIQYAPEKPHDEGMEGKPEMAGSMKEMESMPSMGE